MYRLLAIFFFLSLFLQSCNDGDIIVTTFNFDTAELKSCGGIGNYVFYKVNPDAQESLSLRINFNDSLYRELGIREVVLDGTNNFVNYRTYDGALGNNYFCSSIPPTTPNVTVEYFAASGTAQIETIFVFDDFDGVPSEEEFNGDTDLDGIPNIYDEDDDGDNVSTALELDITDPFTTILDTDADGIPDYLDNDDDGDGVLTRNEDANGDLNPRNDVTDPNVGADYLNPAVAVDYGINLYREHNYTIIKSANIVLKNLVLVSGEETITIETLNMGTLNNVETVSKNTTPTL